MDDEMTLEEENEVDFHALLDIVRKMKSPMWWARSHYPDREDWWTPTESQLLKLAGRGR